MKTTPAGLEFELSDIADVLFRAVDIVREHGIGSGTLYNPETEQVCTLGAIGFASQKLAFERGFRPEPMIGMYADMSDLPNRSKLGDDDVAGHLAWLVREATEPLTGGSIPSWNDNLEAEAEANVIARLQAAAQNIQAFAARKNDGDTWTLDPSTFALKNETTGEEFPIPELELQDRPLVESMLA